MTEAYIDADEWYPVYSLSIEGPKWGTKVDVPLEFFQEYQTNYEKFMEFQYKLHDLDKEASAKKQLEDCNQGIPAHGFN